MRFHIGRYSLQISECRVSFARSQTMMLILLALRAATRTASSLWVSPMVWDTILQKSNEDCPGNDVTVVKWPREEVFGYFWVCLAVICLHMVILQEIQKPWCVCSLLSVTAAEHRQVSGEALPALVECLAHLGCLSQGSRSTLQTLNETCSCAASFGELIRHVLPFFFFYSLCHSWGE